MHQFTKKRLSIALSALGLLVVGCTSGTIPYAGQSTSQLLVPTTPSDSSPLSPIGSTASPSTPLDPTVLQISDVQPRSLKAGDTLTVSGAALDRIGRDNVQLAWVFADRSLPVAIEEQSASRLRIDFPAFPAGQNQVSLHLLVGGKAQQGYVLRILPGVTGTPFPALTPTPSPSGSGSPQASGSPAAGSSPSASDSASPSASGSPASPSPSVSPSASPASASPAASASPSTSPSPSASASPSAAL